MPVPNRWQAHGRFPFVVAKYAGLALVTGVLVALLYRLRVVAIPVLFSGILAYVLHTPMDFLVRRKVPKGLAAALLVFLAVVGVAALGLLIVPTLVVQLSDLAGRLPAMLDALDAAVSPFLQEQLGVDTHLDASAIAGALQAHAMELARPSGWLVSQLFTSALNIVLGAVNTIIVIVFTFYLVKAHDEIATRVLDLVPARHRPSVQAAADAVDDALSGFIRGQVSVCILMAAIYAIVLSIVGVNGGAIIGIIAGLANFVPYLGLATGLSLSLLSVGLDYQGPGQVIAVLATFGILPMIDSVVITPNLVGNRVGLNPFVVIVSLLIGSELLGFLGLLLALPTAAVARALLRLGLDAYRQSRFYRGDDEADSA